MTADLDDMSPKESDDMVMSDEVVSSGVIVLSEVESEKACPVEISEEQHIEVLRQNRAQCLQDGYMLEKEDFDKLHYEDPMVTELKHTEV